MKLNPPAELAGYTYDEKAASRSSLLPRVFGWITFLSFVGIVLSFIFLPEKKPISLSLCVAFFVLLVLYIILKVKKRRLPCQQCRNTMDVLDVKWTPEEWQHKQGYELIGSFTGADGNLYTAEKEKKAGSTHYFIHAHFQRWYVCHPCRSYFLNAKYLRGTLFSTIDGKEFEEAKNSVLSDPKAGDKMEAAYQKRLQGR